MLTPPAPIMTLLSPSRQLFSHPTWVKGQILLIAAILAPGKRTVTVALRVMGLSDAGRFAVYHHVLSRAVWSAHRAAELLLALLMRHLDDGQQLLVFGLDETIERRWGRQIKAGGIYRDAVRSSQSHLVKTSGLRWLSLMRLTAIPWAQRIWALPFLTVWAPSARYYQGSVRQPKKLTDWARQMILQLRRWVPHHQLVVVADDSYAVLYEPAPPYPGLGRPRKSGQRLPTLQAILTEGHTIWQTVTIPWYDRRRRAMEITSATAVWYHNGKPPVPLRWVLVRDPQGQYETLALLSTNLDLSPVQIVTWFVRRWQVEVTFEEAQAHLGLETQRQWSEPAIARTTLILLGLFSWVTLAAHLLVQQGQGSVRQAAWYVKLRPTVSDAISWVCQSLWFPPPTFCRSAAEPDMVKILRSLLDRLVDTLCYAT